MEGDREIPPVLWGRAFRFFLSFYNVVFTVPLMNMNFRVAWRGDSGMGDDVRRIKIKTILMMTNMKIVKFLMTNVKMCTNMSNAQNDVWWHFPRWQGVIMTQETMWSLDSLWLRWRSGWHWFWFCLKHTKFCVKRIFLSCCRRLLPGAPTHFMKAMRRQASLSGGYFTHD